MSRLAATTTTSTCGWRAVLGRSAADDLVLEHRLVDRHRNLLLCLEPHRRVHLLRVLDRRQPKGPHHDALVADAEADLLRELVRRVHRLQAVDEAIGVEDLAVVEGAALEWVDRGGSELRGSIHPHFGGGDAACLDVEADDIAPLLLSGQ